MNQFTIRDIENLCGVKAHTLRVWEQRFGQLFTARRKDSLHRVYDCNDLKELLRISFLYHNGFKISKIAGMSSDQIRDEISKIQPGTCSYELFVHQLVEASIDFDNGGFEKTLHALVVRLGMEKCLIHVLYPFLNRIGLLWMTNHVIPAQEHFASHIVQRKIICAIDGLEEVPTSAAHVILFAPQGEFHEIPLLAVNYLLRKRAIRTTYFGVNIASEVFSDYLEHNDATHLYMHSITRFDTCKMQDEITAIQQRFPNMKMVIAGPACACLAEKEQTYTYLQSMDQLLAFAATLQLQPISALHNS